MGIGASLVLIAVGAVLEWAVNVDSRGVNLHTIGIILMAVGAAGLVIAMVMWAPRRRTARSVTYDEGVAPAGGHRVVREEEYRDTI